MKRVSHRVFSALVAAVSWSLAAGSAHACPMCFNGNGTNTNAFVVGSLFLMVVPVTAIGTLLYMAYKRTKALEMPPPPPPVSRPSSDAQPGDSPAQRALRLVRR